MRIDELEKSNKFRKRNPSFYTESNRLQKKIPVKNVNFESG
jgi:hypothetical protein